MISKDTAQDFLNNVFNQLLEEKTSDAKNYFLGYAEGFIETLSLCGYVTEWCEPYRKKIHSAYVDGGFIKFLCANSDVFERWINHKTIKDDLPCLIDAKWCSLKEDDTSATKENALRLILEYLNCDNVAIELSKEEFNSLIAEGE